MSGIVVFRRWLKKIAFAWRCYNNPPSIPSDTYQKYPSSHKFGGKKVLNVGCGNSVYRHPNVINLDAYGGSGVDLVHDLNKPLPFEDSSFDYIIANHILEHIDNWWDCFKELARVVKVGGIIEVWVPGDGGSSQLGYRDHRHIINQCSFVGIRGTHRNQANAWEKQDAANNGFVRDLIVEGSVRTRAIDFWWTQFVPDVWLLWATEHLRNVIAEVGWFFKKLPQLKEGETWK